MKHWAVNIRVSAVNRKVTRLNIRVAPVNMKVAQANMRVSAPNMNTDASSISTMASNDRIARATSPSRPHHKGPRSHNVTEAPKPDRLDCVHAVNRPKASLRAEAARSKLLRHTTRDARLNETTCCRGKGGASLLLQRRG